MKKFKLTLTTLLLCMVVHVHSQSSHEFIIIDEIADNVEQLISAFGNQSNVYVTDGITPNALGQILKRTENLQIDVLHIYVLTKPGAIVFNSIALTADNMNDWSADLEALSGIVTNKIILHSEVVFTGEEGVLLKEHLEEITGLLFTTEN
jgi:hypothetical protein